MISLDVSPQEDEPGAEAVVHAGELLEVLVRGIGDFALPLITNADIKRVAVADTSGEHLFQTKRSTNRSCEIGRAVCRTIVGCEICNFFA